jgi:hypothetical protein
MTKEDQPKDPTEELKQTLYGLHEENETLRNIIDLKDDGVFRLRLISVLEEISQSLKK